MTRATFRPGLAALAGAALALAPAAQESWVITADVVYTAAGDPIEGGFVVVSDGKIQAVGPGGGRADERFEAAAVTPGLIDLSARIGTGEYSVEQSSETPLALHVVDGIDLFSYRWERELRGGVTSVLVAPQDEAVLGGFGAVLKTGGPPTLEARMVAREAVLRAAMGAQPSQGNIPPRGTPPRNFYYRRPTTRMGVEWVFRDAYYRAKAGAAEDEAERVQNAILERTLEGALPVSVQAWTTQDIRTAVYLKEEFGIPRMFVDAAAEAWKEPELLARSGMGVVLPPYSFAGRVTDQAFFALDTAAELDARGIDVALSAHGSPDVADRLALQPGYAMRGGLPFDAALRSVTSTPARLAGVADRLGSIEVGKDADLVLWSGTPFEPTSRIVGVFLNGELVVDRRDR